MSPEREVPSVPPAKPGPLVNDNKKMIIILIAGIMVILAFVVGVYWFSSRQQVQQIPQTNKQTGVASPAPEPEITNDNGLSPSEVPDPSQDFSAIDKDIQSL